ncbi:MAG: ABC transporter permease, partial [Vicingaceae bacterium]
MSAENKELSPTALAWRKLLRNRLSVIGLIIIALFFLIALIGPFLRPDASPKANEQHLELARKAPGFEVKMLKVPTRMTHQDQSFIKQWIFGVKPQYREIPIVRYELASDGVNIEKYTGNTPNNGEEVFYRIEAWSDLGFTFDEAEHLVNRTFYLGTDRYGRDMLSRLMAGTWISFSVGVIAILISLLIGITLGSLAAFYKGWVDELIMWLINVIW